MRDALRQHPTPISVEPGSTWPTSLRAVPEPERQRLRDGLNRAAQWRSQDFATGGV